jgi:hypothetical protein
MSGELQTSIMWFFFSVAVILVPTALVILSVTGQRQFGVRAISVSFTVAALILGLASYIARK